MTTFENLLESLPITTEALFNSLLDKDCMSIIGEYYDAIDTNIYFYNWRCQFGYQCERNRVFYKVVRTQLYKNGNIKSYTIRRLLDDLTDNRHFKDLEVKKRRKNDNWVQIGERINSIYNTYILSLKPVNPII